MSSNGTECLTDQSRHGVEERLAILVADNSRAAIRLLNRAAFIESFEPTLGIVLRYAECSRHGVFHLLIGPGRDLVCSECFADSLHYVGIDHKPRP